MKIAKNVKNLAKLQKLSNAKMRIKIEKREKHIKRGNSLKCRKIVNTKKKNILAQCVNDMWFSTLFSVGFTLWTSAHGFHHYTLSNRKGWRCIWAFLLLVLVISLISCVIYYFYHVFSTAVYSRVIMESPNQRVWPTTIICEKQGFTLRKINSVPSLTISHASLLSWSLAPDLSRPVVYATNAKIPRWSSSGY